MQNECRVTFEPSGRTVYVLPGTKIFEAAARAGLLLQSPCGGRGTCGKCRVRISKGDCQATAACKQAFEPDRIAAGDRLACQASISGDCVVEVPATSLYESRTQILTTAEARMFTCARRW